MPKQKKVMINQGLFIHPFSDTIILCFPHSSWQPEKQAYLMPSKKPQNKIYSQPSFTGVPISSSPDKENHRYTNHWFSDPPPSPKVTRAALQSFPQAFRSPKAVKTQYLEYFQFFGKYVCLIPRIKGSELAVTLFMPLAMLSKNPQTLLSYPGS